MRRKREIVPAISHVFLVLIMLMLANNVVFYHEHNLSTGVTIRHAHPFLSEEEEQERDHTENELILLDLLSHETYFWPDVVFYMEREVFAYVIQPISYFSIAPAFDYQTVLSLRGPPALFCRFSSPIQRVV
ncbi:hypothetical protein [Lunatimonas salinarum]|uniref:hypothetical protein n=1 Tax=Lunatimonas salinarum TaxID=1774590 RepID=UPI001ADF1721|nr:hypothetical protein [Lunatimonas salinarum]